MPTAASNPPLRRALTWLRRNRRSLAAAVAVLAVLSAVRSVRPADPPSATVLVAARDLDAGSRVSDGDLRARAVPRRLVPAGALTPASPPTGRVVALPVRSGEIVTDVRLLGPGLLDGLGPDTVAAPVRLADSSAVGVVQVGDLVDVLAAGESGAGGVVASRARVLAAPRAGADAVVVLAVGDDAAHALARASATARISLVLRPG